MRQASTGARIRAEAAARTAVFLDRDGTLNRPNGYIARPDRLELFDFSAAAVRKLNAAGLLAILITNQAVIARGDCTLDDLAQIHARLAARLARDGASLDAIYYCPHHPDRAFPGGVAELKIDCACRKPRPGLLLEAQADFDIDLKASWMIGDSFRDVGAARACGVSSVLVRTGDVEDPAELEARADFAFDDVRLAADFIVDAYAGLARLAQPIAGTLAQGRDLFVAGPPDGAVALFARTLARELRLTGRDATVVSLDRWTRPDEVGADGGFDLDGALAACRAAARRGAGPLELADLPVFSRRRRVRRIANEPLALAPQTIVIWEGAPAAALAARLGLAASCVFVECDANGQAQRVVGARFGQAAPAQVAGRTGL